MKTEQNRIQTIYIWIQFQLILTLVMLVACTANRQSFAQQTKETATKPASRSATSVLSAHATKKIDGKKPSAGVSLGRDAKVIFLHKSIGYYIYNGGNVSGWMSNYNRAHGTHYHMDEREFPNGEPYWVNMPQQYWNIWINHAGPNPVSGEPTLEIITKTYDVIVWKHCYPVSNVVVSKERPDVASPTQTLQNYRLQYLSLMDKMRQFTNKRFLVWTGAALVQGETDQVKAKRAKEFFEWVKEKWDEPKDNIFIWDFWELETEGELYLRPQYAVSASDSHPNGRFATKVGPYLGQRIVDVIEGQGDIASITGRPSPR